MPCAVTADGKKSRVPIELEILDFTLPDENSVRAMVYYEPSQPEQYHGRNLDAAYHRFAHRQRVELVNAYDEAELRAHLGRFSGSDFTAASGYAGPGEGVGNEIVPASFYGPPPAYEERASAWKAADAWVSFLKTLLPKALTFLYLPDEPYPAEYPHVQEARRQRALQSRTGRQPRHVRDEGDRAGAARAPSTSGAFRRRPSRSRRPTRSAGRAGGSGSTTADDRKGRRC